MITIFGKGKIGNSAQKLLNHLNIKNKIIDDEDWDADILDQSEKIIISPGVPQTHKIYQLYKDKIIGDYDFVQEIIQQRNLENKFITVAITGTDGKSSVTWILYNIFEKLNKPGYKAWIGGNYDRPITDIFLEILQGDEKDQKNILILELSSFMGYNIKKTKFQYSIWTNFERDHLNWHPDMQEYFQAKLNIIKNTSNMSFVNPKLIGKINLPNVKSFDTNYDLSETNFIGNHNKQNLSACYLTAKQLIQDYGLEVADEQLKNIINEIKPLPHRIQLVRNIDGIKIYDDGKSTTANSLNAAISSFDNKIILIAGGSDKGDDFNVLKNIFKEKIDFAVLLGQTAPQIGKIFDEIGVGYIIAKNMSDAVNIAYNQAKSNSKTILFSPGCASFDMFKNREDRVNQFLQAVNSL